MTDEAREQDAEDEDVLVVGKAAGEVRAAAVIGADTRRRIRTTTKAPFRLICSLEITGPAGGGVIGTGWYVGPRTLITAGHCVYDPDSIGGWATEIVVTPGRDGEERPFGSQTAKRFSAHKKWIESLQQDFDMAAIHLDEPLEDGVEPFVVKVMPDAALKNAMVNVSGYPADRGFGAEQYWAKNRIRRVGRNRLYYDVDTYGGQSGAPLYHIPAPGAAPVVVGVHAYGLGGPSDDPNLEVNSAPRITAATEQLIKRWAAGETDHP